MTIIPTANAFELCVNGFGICNPELPQLNPDVITSSTATVNNSSLNVNNSQYLQGLTPQQVANLYVETDTKSLGAINGNLTAWINNNTNHAFTNNSNNWTIGVQNFTNGNLTNINFLCNNSGTCFNINDLNKTSNLSYFQINRTSNNITLGKTNFTNGNLTNINFVCNNTGSCFTLSQLNSSSGSISENQTFNFVNITRNLSFGKMTVSNVTTSIGEGLLFSTANNRGWYVYDTGTQAQYGDTQYIITGRYSSHNFNSIRFGYDFFRKAGVMQSEPNGTNTAIPLIFSALTNPSIGNEFLEQLVLFNGTSSDSFNVGRVAFGTTTDNCNARVCIYEDTSFPNTPTASQGLAIASNGQSVMSFITGSQTGTKTIQGYTKGDSAGNLAYGAKNQVIFESGGFGYYNQTAAFTPAHNLIIGTYTDDLVSKLQVNGNATILQYLEVNGNDYNSSFKVIGNRITPECIGTLAPVCGYQGNEAVCNEISGCIWQDDCAGTLTCSVYNEGDCNSHADYCNTETTCGGTHTVCSMYGESDCETHGCTKNYIDPMNCACGNQYCENGACTDQPSCEGDPCYSTWHPDTMSCACGAIQWNGCSGEPHACQQSECDATTDGCANTFTSCVNDGTCSVIPVVDCESYEACDIGKTCGGSMLDTSCSQISLENCTASITGYCSAIGNEEDKPVVTAVSGLGQTNDTYQCIDQAGNMPWYSDYQCKLFANNVQFGNVTMTELIVTNNVSIGHNLTMNGGIIRNVSQINPMGSPLLIGGDLNLTGNINIVGNLSVKRYYWNGYYNGTDNFVNTSAVQRMNLSNNLDYDAYGIVINATQAIKFDHTGDYLCQISPEFTNTAVTAQIAFWMRKNGVDVKWSNSRFSISNGEYDAPAVPFQFDIENPATDFIEFYWYSTSTNSQLVSVAAPTNPSRPGIPAVIVNCQKVGEITD